MTDTTSKTTEPNGDATPVDSSAMLAKKNEDLIRGMSVAISGHEDMTPCEIIREIYSYKKQREAIEKIASQDYRGNMTTEMRIARDALIS